MERLGVGLLGLGTVGSGVARLLEGAGDRLARRSGRRLELRWAVVRDPGRSRPVELGAERLTTDPRRVLDDPDVRVVVETWGGIEPARGGGLEALGRGKGGGTGQQAPPGR